MLVITRKQGQTIRINDNIVIRVLDLGHGNVRLGIDAPRDIAIMRGELTGPCLKVEPKKPSEPQ